MVVNFSFSFWGDRGGVLLISLLEFNFDSFLYFSCSCRFKYEFSLFCFVYFNSETMFNNDVFRMGIIEKYSGKDRFLLEGFFSLL